MPDLREVRDFAGDAIKHPYAAASIAAGMILTDVFAGNAFDIHAGDSPAGQVLKAYPSALAIPEVTGYEAVDLGIQIGASVAGLELASRTSTRGEVLVTAAGAQAVACTINGAIGYAGALSPGEQKIPDNGASAMWGSLVFKWLLDKMSVSENSRPWKIGAGVFGVGMVAAPLVSGDKLGAAAHVSALGFAAVVHRLRKAKLHQRLASDYAAA